MTIQVVGLTTQQEVFIASKDKKFKINELLKILDKSLGEPLGEVIETQSYNRYIPLDINSSFVDNGVIESLKNVGFNIDKDEIHIAKLKLLEEAPYPVQTGASVVEPEFDEVKDILVKEQPSEGLVAGVIKGTENMTDGMDRELQNIAPLLFGDEVEDQEGIPFNFKFKAMHDYPHIGVIGGSGSGKSFGLRVLQEELMKLGFPTIVFDPHFEMDFSEQFPGLPKEHQKDFEDKFRIYRIGHNTGVKFEDLSSEDLRTLLGTVKDLSDSMSNAVQKLHQNKDSLFTFQTRLEDLQQAQQLGRKEIEKRLNTGLAPDDERMHEELLEVLNNYGDLPSASVDGLVWRLGKLVREGIFNQDIEGVLDDIQNGKLVVIQGSIWLLQVYAAYTLGVMYRKRREFKDAKYRGEEADYFPPFVVATDEAHNFAPQGYDAPASKKFKEIAQEGRKYGTFLVLATQRPTLLNETVTAQLNTKFVFRTVRASDIDTVKQETDLTPDEAKRLPYLKSGDAFVSSAIFGRTLAVRIRVAKTDSPHSENPYDEWKERIQAKDDEIYESVVNSLPINDMNLTTSLSEINSRLDGKTLTVDKLLEQLDMLVKKGRIQAQESPLGDTVYNIAK